MDSTSAISNVKLIRDRIPKRRYADNADVLSIIRSAPEIVIKYQLEHVKSHQDDATDIEKLPFSAQLNVWCDALATTQLGRQSSHPEEASLSNPLGYRNHPVAVFFGDQEISSHYVSRLRDAIGRARHRSYLQQKYQWDGNTLESIAWDAIEFVAGRAHLSHPVNRCKIVHNWLNLGSQQSKIGKCSNRAIESRYPFCEDEETFCHLLTCNAPRAVKIRYDAYGTLRKTIGSDRGGSAILQAIKTWTLAPANPVIVLPTQLSHENSLNRASASQTAIGWEHLFRGFVSKEWGCIHSDSDTTPLEQRASMAKKNLSVTIKAVQDYTITIRQGRNLALHEAGSNGQASVHATLNESITRMYGLQETFSPILQSYFNLPLEDRLRKPPRHRARWLTLAQLATSHSSSQGARQALVSRYFAYTAPQEPATLENETSLPGTPTASNLSAP